MSDTFIIDGNYFFVNADVRNKKSFLLVELQDENGTPIPGFTKKDCVAMKKANSTKYQISWNSDRNLGALEGKAVRVKFYLRDADLYAFWISPWETGESRGYTAGGGPGLSWTGVDEKR